MKRLVIVVLSLFVGLHMSAQNLVYKTDNEREYEIGVKPEQVKNLGVALSHSLDKTTGASRWTIIFNVIGWETPFNFDKGSILLIRTCGGSVLKLYQVLDCHDVLLPSKHDDIVGRLYRAQPRFNISQEELDILINEGIKKLRFDSTAGFMDYAHEHDYIGTILKKQKKIIIAESDFNRGY